MRKNILIVTVMSIILGINFTTSLAQATIEQQVQIATDQETANTYSDLSLLSVKDRKPLYSSLTPELKSKLWKLQLRLYLSKHSDLTGRQNKAIEDAIVFIRPQFYKISPDSPDWEEKVNRPVQLQEKRILEVFPREAVREFLTNIGGSEPRISLNLRQINFAPKITDSGCSGDNKEVNPWITKKQPLLTSNIMSTRFNMGKIISVSFKSFESCSCSMRSDYCTEGSQCGDTNCGIAQFCGTSGLYICDGACLIFMNFT